jgi:hypothetical protein
MGTPNNNNNDNVRACVQLIFDSNEENARLIGVEYVVSERLFKGLPEEEKKLWHRCALHCHAQSPAKELDVDLTCDVCCAYAVITTRSSRACWYSRACPR